MKLIPIENIGLLSSQYVLGTWAFGNCYWENQQHTDTIKTFHSAIRNSINHFDTAESYGNGRSEQITGQQLGKTRERNIIATKAVYKDSDKLIKSVETSLKRMNTNYLDIFYIHWPNQEMNFQKTADTLNQLKDSGTIKSFGISNFNIQQLERISHLIKPDIVQYGYNLLWRKPEKDIIPFCEANKITFSCYSPLAQGLLTGKFNNNDAPLPTGRRADLIFFSEKFKEPTFRLLNKLTELAIQSGHPPAILALKWLETKSFSPLIILGARTREQLEQNLMAAEIQIPIGILDKLTEISDELNTLLPDHTNYFYHNN